MNSLRSRVRESSLLKQPNYTPLGEPGHWTQKINDLLAEPLKVDKLPTKHPQVLLQALLWQLDRFISYDAIVDLLWGNDPDGGPLCAKNIIAVTIHRLRQEGHKIETEHGFGIRLRSSG